MMHIIGDLPFHLGWMKTKRIIMICEDCCQRLRETYHLLDMCHKNSAVLQGYMEKLNTDSISTADNEAELRVHLNSEHAGINKIKCEINAEDEEIYTVESVPIEENQEVFVNVDDDCFVKDEVSWKMEEVDDEQVPPMDNNSTETSDNEPDSETAVKDTDTEPDSETAVKDTDTEPDSETAVNDTDTDSDSSEFTSTQVHTTNKKKPNTPAKKPYKCLTCSKSFIRKDHLQIHTRIHTGEKPYKCTTCEKRFIQQSGLMSHLLIHTGEKQFECSRCNKCFRTAGNLASHMRTYTGEKPFKCTICEKCFSWKSNLVRHMRIHTDKKPVE